MRRILIDLKEMGCDIGKALERFFYDEELYIQCYCKLIESEEFGRLHESVIVKEMEAALKSTHSLKGALANLELTPMRDVVLEVEAYVKTDAWKEALLKCLELVELRKIYSNILQE